ncbi:MAG TPA: response regulator transcription factor [Polyangiaceae bacterium]
MRTIVYHFDDPRAFRSFVTGSEHELALPPAETITDGEWILAIFEVGTRKRATAAAARGKDRGEQDLVLVFEDRDWSRIVAFSEAAEASLSGENAAAAPRTATGVPIPKRIPTDAPTKKSLSRPPPAIPDDIPSDPSDTQVSRTDDAFAPPRSPVPPPTSSDRAKPSRVLLVEDDPAMSRMVSSMLEADGLLVECVDTGEEGLEKALAEPFDLAVLDWNLPGMNGLELCKKLRKEKSLAPLPILFLTGHASSKDVVDAFSSGADDFVSKPFRAPELNARIMGLLRRARVSAPQMEMEDDEA